MSWFYALCSESSYQCPHLSITQWARPQKTLRKFFSPPQGPLLYPVDPVTREEKLGDTLSLRGFGEAVGSFCS